MIKCPHCGADHRYLTADIQVIVSCELDEDGTFLQKPYWDTANINDVLHEQYNEVTLFCSNCGWTDMPAEYSNDGQRIVTGDEL